MDFFLIPLRKRAAEAELKVIEAEIGQRVLNLVKEVQINWLELKTLEVQLQEEGKRVELKELAAALADLQKKAGNINNVMTLGSYDLLDLKESEIQATIEHVQAFQHYKKARIELLHAVGGSFALLRKRE